MLSPILRLLATYLAVGLVVFAFFNRDRLAETLGWQDRGAPVTTASAASQKDTPAAAPVATPGLAPQTTPAAPVFAPPPGENGVPDIASGPASVAVSTSAMALQTPTPPPASPDPAAELQRPGPPPASSPTQPAADIPDQITPPDRFERQIAAARAAYWQGDVATAIARYRDLLAQYPDNESLHGELGNIYYMNGKRIEAAMQYEAAGMAALKAGRVQQAQMLFGVLSALDRAAAARLQKAMEGSE